MVQVYGCERERGWVKRCCGVACLVQDRPRRSYYIRVLDMKVSLVPGLVLVLGLVLDLDLDLSGSLLWSLPV